MTLTHLRSRVRLECGVMRALPALFVAFALIGTADAEAKRIYQYRDANGILHFTDRKPQDATAEIKETIVKVDRQPIVDLVTSDVGTTRKLGFRNRLGGPVELELAFGTLENMVTEPESPIRVVLPPHLRTLAKVDGELRLEVEGEVTLRSVLDALETRYPMLRGTIRDHGTLQRRPFLRFFACEEDLSHQPPDTPLPAAVASGAEPLFIVGAIAGG